MKKKISASVLSYPQNASAPFLLTKGKGKIAEKIIEIANENSIPIVKDEILDNVLSIQEIGEYVPEETFEVLAKIFAFIKMEKV